jgi:hypothetical protein
VVQHQWPPGVIKPEECDLPLRDLGQGRLFFKQQTTMATTNSSTIKGLPGPLGNTQFSRYATLVPKPIAPFPTPTFGLFDRVKFFFQSLIGQCCYPQEYAAYQQYEGFRQQVLSHYTELSDRPVHPVVGAAVDEYLSTGYDIVGIGNTVTRVINSNPSPMDVKNVADKYGLSKRELRQASRRPYRGRAKLTSRFVAACVMHLRSKLGHMTESEANILVVERAYHNVCRDQNVRVVDIDLHRQVVLNLFFDDVAFQHVADSRVRLASWLQARKSNKHTIHVC